MINLLDIDGAAVEYNNKVYFAESASNALYSMDLSTGELIIESLLKSEKKERTYRLAFRYGSQAWFLPWELDVFMHVDLDNLDIEYIKIPYQKRENKVLSNYSPTYPTCCYFSAVKIDEERIFCVPVDVDVFVIINMKTGEIIEFENLINFESEIMWAASCIGNDIYISPYKGDRMVKLNWLTGNVDYINWPYGEGVFCSSMAVDDSIYFAPNTANCLLRYDTQKNIFEEILLGDMYDFGNSYHELCLNEGVLWLIPWRSDYILQYDIQAKSWGKRKKDDEICWPYKTELRCVDSEDKIIFTTCRTGYISVYQKESQKFINYIGRISGGCDFKMISGAVGDFVSEKILALNTYIEMVAKGGYEKQRGVRGDE